MNAPRFIVETRGVAEPQGTLDIMRHEARRISGRYPGLAGMQFIVERVAGGFEARIDLTFDDARLVVAGAGAVAERAIGKAVAQAARALLAMEARDPHWRLRAPGTPDREAAKAA